MVLGHLLLVCDYATENSGKILALLIEFIPALPQDGLRILDKWILGLGGCHSGEALEGWGGGGVQFSL